MYRHIDIQKIFSVCSQMPVFVMHMPGEAGHDPSEEGERANGQEEKPQKEDLE